jgi:hypothetical protein
MFPDSFLSSSLYPTGTEMAGQVTRSLDSRSVVYEQVSFFPEPETDGFLGRNR